MKALFEKQKFVSLLSVILILSSAGVFVLYSKTITTSLEPIIASPSVATVVYYAQELDYGAGLHFPEEQNVAYEYEKVVLERARSDFEYGLVCDDAVSCGRMCSDPDGQFYDYPDCENFRQALKVAQISQEARSVLPQSMENLPSGIACADETACAVRCMQAQSPYYLTQECVSYREEQLPGESRSGKTFFLSNILQSMRAMFSGSGR